MTITTTIIEDNADHTVTVVVDDVLGTRTETLVYKPGTRGANVQVLLGRADAALSDITTARALISGGGAKWDGLTPAQRTAFVDGLLADVGALIRLAIGRLESTT
jgi:ABC-type amino acid transport substrate-binding protein